MQTMYYIGLDVHKRTISYCVKDGSGTIHAEGAIPATRFDLDRWMKTLPQPWWWKRVAASLRRVWRRTRRISSARRLPGLAVKPTGRKSASSGCSHRLVSRLAGNTNSIFCSRPLAGLRQQMEVWFYRE
jgi:hypothetical protein